MTVLFFCLYLACIWSMLGTEPCLASPVVLFELIHRRAAGIAGLRARGMRLREREHAVHIHGCAIRAWNCRSGNATDILLSCLSGGVMIQSSRKFPRSPPGGFSLFWKITKKHCCSSAAPSFFLETRLLQIPYPLPTSAQPDFA